MDVLQTGKTLLMIRPSAFGSNPETAETNAFQTPASDPPDHVHERALAEFDALVSVLRDVGVDVVVIDDEPDPVTPDAVFPNNWISLHQNGDVFLYPMQPKSRRAEVRRDVVDRLVDDYGFRVERVVDLSGLTEDGVYLEGTGSLVLDHLHRVAYAALSPRTDAAAVDRFCDETGYEPLCFGTAGAVYHTNVVMCIGTSFAVVCADVIDEVARRAVLARLAHSGRDVVEIDTGQMGNFAGNMLEVRSRDGRALVVASTRAHDALRDDQRRRIEQHATFVTCDLRTIEAHGGGSARCMLAEVFLPRAASRC